MTSTGNSSFQDSTTAAGLRALGDSQPESVTILGV
jgi:hypothetical protein